MTKYEVIIYWGQEDEAYVAEVPELAGCAAHGEAVPSRRLQPIAELVADLTRSAVGDDNGRRREQECPGAAGQLRGPGNDRKRGVLDTGGEDEQREEVDHADRISLAETFGER